MAQIRLIVAIAGVGDADVVVAVSTEAARKFIAAGKARTLDSPVPEVPVAPPVPVSVPVAPVVEDLPDLEDPVPDFKVTAHKGPKKGK